MSIELIEYALNRGLDRVIESEVPVPELPPMNELTPPSQEPTATLDHFLRTPTINDVLYDAIRPVITTPDVLMPRGFREGLSRAQAMLRLAKQRNPKLNRALEDLEDEVRNRELLAMYQHALVPG